MRLASIRYREQDLVVVAADDGRLYDINTLLTRRAAERDGFETMLEVIAAGEVLWPALRAALARADGTAAIDPAKVSWYPPVRLPGKICAVAMNNSASNARKIAAPDHPAFFLKPASCLVGHGEPIRIRSYYGSVHPEPELAVVIGRKTRDVAATDALACIYGYTIFNDITGNGMRAEDMFHYWAIYAKLENPDETEPVEQHLSYAARYKGSDCFGVMGPWLVSRDAIENPDNLNVYCKIHGETIAEDNTRFYNYKIAEVISFISHFHTLHPGDVVSFGTAFKPSASRKSIHHANFQKVPGPVEIEIDGLGHQENTIVIEDQELGQWRLS
jgi:2-keto-4-pentenoate hydratase/2-oxohepta-3-ene-1,7-dioic acid hydratase in catechol pathway